MKASAALAAALLGLGLGCAGPDEKGIPEGWKPDGELRLFQGAELYGHINGGAEVFLELGFLSLQVKTFARGASKISVEIYEMADHAAAVGIYALKCGKETPDPSLQARHTRSSYHLLLVKGRYYAVIRNLEGDEQAAAALALFARSLDLPVDPARDESSFELLPKAGLIPGTERVVRGPFTLDAVYSLGEGDPLLLEEGRTALAADYDDGADGSFTYLCASYPDEETAARVLQRIGERLDPTFRILSSTTEEVVFCDYAKRLGKAVRKGDRVVVIARLAPLSKND